MFTCGLLASACTMTALIPNLPNRNYIRLSPNIPPPPNLPSATEQIVSSINRP
ncbi:hypothetical protein HMPREF1554_00105 [Porphyromonas gingivalis F0569]|nr:hypothetical protein HMPREF1554_00105 [Porphyromonas gingivalis F0569]